MNAHRTIMSPPTALPVTTPRPPDGSRTSYWAALRHGAARGLLPLLTLLISAGLTVALTMAAWQLTSGLDFFARRTMVVTVAAAGLAASAVLYGVTCIRALRRAAHREAEGNTADALGILAALACTAIVVALPLLIAVLLPQHPAP